MANQSTLENGFFAEINEKGENSSFFTEEHLHRHHEIYFLIKGDIKYFVNNEILCIYENDTAFIKGGYIHRTSYNSGKYSKRLLVSFSSEFIGENYLDLVNELGNKKLFESTKENGIDKILMKIYTEYTSKKPHYLKQCKNLLRELLIVMYRLQTQELSQALSENEKLIQSAAKYISSHLSEDITLSFLAQKFAMSDSHFSRTFKQYTGLGVSKYIKLCRLKKAEELLVAGGFSVTQIALKCGFNNSNYFISEFKKHQGITPFKYSTIHREN